MNNSFRLNSRIQVADTRTQNIHLRSRQPQMPPLLQMQNNFMMQQLSMQREYMNHMMGMEKANFWTSFGLGMLDLAKGIVGDVKDGIDAKTQSKIDTLQGLYGGGGDNAKFHVVAQGKGVFHICNDQGPQLSGSYEYLCSMAHDFMAANSPEGAGAGTGAGAIQDGAGTDQGAAQVGGQEGSQGGNSAAPTALESFLDLFGDGTGLSATIEGGQTKLTSGDYEGTIRLPRGAQAEEGSYPKELIMTLPQGYGGKDNPVMKLTLVDPENGIYETSAHDRQFQIDISDGKVTMKAVNLDGLQSTLDEHISAYQNSGGNSDVGFNPKSYGSWVRMSTQDGMTPEKLAEQKSSIEEQAASEGKTHSRIYAEANALEGFNEASIRKLQAMIIEMNPSVFNTSDCNFKPDADMSKLDLPSIGVLNKILEEQQAQETSTENTAKQSTETGNNADKVVDNRPDGLRQVNNAEYKDYFIDDFSNRVYHRVEVKHDDGSIEYKYVESNMSNKMKAEIDHKDFDVTEMSTQWKPENSDQTNFTPPYWAPEE